MRVVLALLVASTMPAFAAKAEKPKADPAMRERVAVLVLRRAAFGAYSFLPVRFSKSRLAGPFEDDGRTTFCVSTHMGGRSFGKDERPRAIVRLKADGKLESSDYDSDVCSGHRTEPFPELETAAGRKS